MMSPDEWAVEQTARVVEDVERHGVGITWSEAHRRLLEGVRFLNLPVYVDQGGGELRPLEPVDAAPEWICPGFAEEVACSVVHREGKAFFPVEPAASHTGIAVPWDTASELVARLNFVLCARLCQAGSLPEVDALRELAGLIVDLSSSVAGELGWVGDGTSSMTTRSKGGATC
jgi:hypothetical protein